MSVIEEQRKEDSKRRCGTFFCRLFPHVFLILSLISYAVLGALIFLHIEKNDSYNELEEIRKVARDVMETVNNHTDNSTQAFVKKIKEILTKYQVSQQQNQNWTFFRSLFFSCTVFTTIGYGHMYPVTISGKVACILYAIVGIPLMLLVISDVGDILAVFLSKAYTRLTLSCRRWRAQRAWRHIHRKASALQVPRESDGTYTFCQDKVVHETINIQQAIKTQSSFRRRSMQLSNREIFDRIIVQENFKASGELTKTSSCPELDQMSSSKVSSLFTGIGEEMEHLNVPILIILLVVFAYMVTCSQILNIWEDNLSSFDAFYFTFITLTTIGFGDFVPIHQKYFMVTFLFIITGMAILSMAFKLSQSQIVNCYRRFIKCFSMGKVGTSKDGHNN